MQKIHLSDEKLLEILKISTDDQVMEEYYDAALKNLIIADEEDSMIKFLLILVRYYDNKLFAKTEVDALTLFGMQHFDKQGEYYKFYKLLNRTQFEIVECSKIGYIIPEFALVEFYERYAHALYMFGHYFKCLEICQQIISKDNINTLANFLKASIIEFCYINKTSDEYKAALYNYQESLIKKCDPSNPIIDKRVYEEVLKIVDLRTEWKGEIGKGFSFISVPETFEKAQALVENWTEEKDYYLRNKLFLNPLNIFECFSAASIEDLEDLKIDAEHNNLFNAIIEDYKLCRHITYLFYKELNGVKKREMSMAYSYIYSIFDKISFLLKKVYDLDIDERDVSFTYKKLFDIKISGTDFKFKDIRNDNILPLYMIMEDIREKKEVTNVSAVATFEHNKIRNFVEHRSLTLFDDAALKRNTIILLKLAQHAILHTFSLLHTCSKKDAIDKITSIGTTLHFAGLNIAKEDKKAADLSK